MDVFEFSMSAGGLEYCLIQKNLKQTSLHGPTVWKGMQRNARRDIANLQTKQLNKCTESQLHEKTTINSKKKKWDLLEICRRSAHK